MRQFSIPQGTILLKFSNSQSILIENPFIVIHLLQPIPIEAIFLFPIQTPVRPSLEWQFILKVPRIFIIISSIYLKDQFKSLLKFFKSTTK